MELGLQLFGCADIFRRSPEAFFKAVAGYGYRYMEPCIWFGDPEGIEPALRAHFWTVDEFERFYALMQAQELDCISFHGFGDLVKHGGALKDFIAAYGIRYPVVNLPDADFAAAFAPYTAMLRAVCALLSGTGAQLLLHNCGEVMKQQVNGRNYLEAALEECSGLAGAQIDVGWVAYAGIDPLELIKRLERFPLCIHYKDVKKDFMKAAQIHTCLGTGIIDVPAIYAYTRDLTVPPFIDQDTSDGDLMQDLKQTAALMRTLMQKQ